MSFGSGHKNVKRVGSKRLVDVPQKISSQNAVTFVVAFIWKTIPCFFLTSDFNVSQRIWIIWRQIFSFVKKGASHTYCMEHFFLLFLVVFPQNRQAVALCVGPAGSNPRSMTALAHSVSTTAIHNRTFWGTLRIGWEIRCWVGVRSSDVCS